MNRNASFLSYKGGGDISERVQQRMRAWGAANKRILVALSGGPDSVALAHILKSRSYDLVIGHVDHQLRPSSGRDARFVRDLARRWNLSCEVATVRVASHALRRQRGIEEAARDLRYKALIQMARKKRCAFIATAHNADDQAETILMNFLRGAGPAGLAGIPPLRPLAPGRQLVRPLLDSPRAEILAYLKTHRLPSRQDPSNRSLRFTRNRIRHRLLPLLENAFPKLKQRLLGLGEIFREEQALWGPQIRHEINKTVRQYNKKITVDLAQLLGYHKALGRRILRHLLTAISFQDTERIFQLAQSPKGHLTVQLSDGTQVERKGNKLIIPQDPYEQR